jgi:hypothetical protein
MGLTTLKKNIVISTHSSIATRVGWKMRRLCRGRRRSILASQFLYSMYFTQDTTVIATTTTIATHVSHHHHEYGMEEED